MRARPEIQAPIAASLRPRPLGAGKRRASDGLAQEANANTPPGKRSRNDSVDTPPSTSGSEEPPRLPTKSSATHAAQEVAKVHGLLKSLTYVRCDPSTVGPS